MNEVDLTTKIEGLKKAIAEHNDFAKNYASDLAKVEQELKDLDDMTQERDCARLHECEWQNKQDVATRARELDLQNKLDKIKRIVDYE